MKTLYIRNVPDDVAAHLSRLAALHGVSVNTVVLRELSSLVRRSRNAETFAALPSDPHPIDPDQLVALIHAARADP